jgi:hypothetical protein
MLEGTPVHRSANSWHACLLTHLNCLAIVIQSFIVFAIIDVIHSPDAEPFEDALVAFVKVVPDAAVVTCVTHPGAACKGAVVEWELDATARIQPAATRVIWMWREKWSVAEQSCDFVSSA